MSQKHKSSSGRITGLIIFLLLAVILFCIFRIARPAPIQGTKKVTVEIVHSDSTTKTFDYETSLEYLGDLLVREGLVNDDKSEYGLFITTADGETADYEKDKAYWALYENGEYAQQGADQTVLADGGIYGLVYTKDGN